MSKVFDWSTSAGSNNDAPPDGWPENMLPGKVNDCAREMMSAIAAWYADQTASLTTAGTTTAYTLTTNSGYDALSDIPLLVFRAHAANTGACTLNVDGLGAKPLRKSGGTDDYSAGELAADQLLVVAYNATSDNFEAVGPAPAPPAAEEVFSSGTPMIFGQTSAPTGWTKSLTHNNKALRLVTGTASSGGTTAFTSVFTSRTITLAHLPSADLSLASLTGFVNESISNGTNVARNFDTNTATNNQTGGGGNIVLSSSWDEDNLSLSDGDVAFGGTLPLGGADTPMDFAVQYVDVIMATKD